MLLLSFFLEFECQQLKEVLDLFLSVIETMVNVLKSTLYLISIYESLMNYMVNTLYVSHFDLEEGIKYLGNVLKSNNYGVVD